MFVYLVAGDAVHAALAALVAAEDVAAAHHEPDLDAALLQPVQLLGQGLDALEADPVFGVPGQDLAGELQQDAPELDLHVGALPSERGRTRTSVISPRPAGSARSAPRRCSRPAWRSRP